MQQESKPTSTTNSPEISNHRFKWWAFLFGFDIELENPIENELKSHKVPPLSFRSGLQHSKISNSDVGHWSASKSERNYSVVAV